MANETTLINGITKREKDNILIYYFPTALITADTVQNTYTVKQLQAPETQLTVAFDDITQKFGATNIEEYCDQLAILEFYFELPPSEQPTIWGNIQGTLSAQTDLQTELDDRQTVAPLGLSIGKDGGWRSASVAVTDPIWIYNNNTVIANPASGNVRFDNVDLALATRVAISQTTSQGSQFGSVLGIVTDRSILVLRKFTAFTEYIIAEVFNIVDEGGWVSADLQVLDAVNFSGNGVETTIKIARINAVTDNTIDGDGTLDNPFSVAGGGGGGAYGEIYASSNLSQSLAGAGDVLVFNANGEVSNMTVNQSGNEIVITEDGVYEVRADITFNLEKETKYMLFLRVNGVNIRELAEVQSKEEDFTTTYIGGGMIISLSATDTVQLYCDPTGSNKDFNMRIGSRLAIRKLG